MKSFALKLILSFGLVIAAFAPAGCQSTPNQIAYKTTAATIATVDTAMQAWADYVVTERSRIARLAPADQGSHASDLLRSEGKVREAFGKYQLAVANADLLVATADSPSSGELAAAASTLLSVIQTLTKH